MQVIRPRKVQQDVSLVRAPNHLSDILGLIFSLVAEMPLLNSLTVKIMYPHLRLGSISELSSQDQAVPRAERHQARAITKIFDWA
jgi:hypothetical protein